MGSPFPNEVAGGNGVLLIPAIQSPNFSISGMTGWAIMQNGDAYFYSITADGSVTATKFEGTDFEIDNTGMYFYGSTPGPGVLPFFWITNSGTDPYGNTVPRVMGSGTPGGSSMNVDGTGNFYIYNSAGKLVNFIYTGDGSMRIYNSSGPAPGNMLLALSPDAGNDAHGNSFAPGLTIFGANAANPTLGVSFETTNPDQTAPGFLATSVNNPGASGEQYVLSMTSPQISGAADRADIAVFSAIKGTPGSALGVLSYYDTTGAEHVQVQWGNGYTLIVNQSLPGSDSSGPVIYGGSGQLKYVGAENSAYNTGIAHLITTGQPVSSTTPAGVTGVTLINVGSNTYVIRGLLTGSVGTSSKPVIGITGPAITGMRVNLKFFSVNGVNYYGCVSLTSLGNATCPTALVSGFECSIEGVIEFSAAAATFGLTVAEGTSGDTWTLEPYGYLDLMPST